MHAIGVGFYVGAGIPKGGPCRHCNKLRANHWLGADNTAFCDTNDLGTHVLFGPIASEQQFEPQRVNKFIECGCCGAYHRADFNGDCREDSERHWDLPDDAEVIYLDDDEYDDDDPPHSSDCPRSVLSSAECMCPAENARRYRDED